MVICKGKSELKTLLNPVRERGEKIAFVPTMGFLHEGHLSLIDAAKSKSDYVVCSIYVNPSQFNDPSDFENYPTNLERDTALLIDRKCDLLWLPDRAEIEEMDLPFSYEVNQVDLPLEGEYRPGHFKGVIEIVYRLFSAVSPHVALFGEKDYQQFQIISQMVKANQLGINIEAIATLREKDGLAMSSRNVRLSEQEREVAPALYRLMSSCRGLKENGLEKQIKAIKGELASLGYEIDYIQSHQFETEIRLFAAVHLGSVRLIDNIKI